MGSLTASPAGFIAAPPVALRLLSDARLMRLAAAGSDGAMAAIFERHHQALHRYCHSILGNGHDAADALQNTMLKALRALPGETRQLELRPWLYRIAHNESISLLRARRHDSDLAGAMHVSDPVAAAAIESRDQLRCLTEDLAELSERQRGALLMRELGSLEFTEIAAAFGTSPSAVKQNVYEARQALHAMREGRAMDCDDVRRTLSDGDRRTLRAMRMRGHIRACAGCRDFQAAMHQRPAQLAAIIPPLPAAAATAMLHGVFGSGSGGGGALTAGIAGGAKTATGLSLGAKTIAVVAASATLAGGALYAVPKLDSTGAARDAARSEQAAPESTPRTLLPGTAIVRQRQRSATAATRANRERQGGSAATTAANRPPTHTGRPDATPGGKPAVTHTGRPDVTPTGKPAGTPDPPATTPQPPVNTPNPATASAAGAPAGTPGPPPRQTAPRRR